VAVLIRRSTVSRGAAWWILALGLAGAAPARAQTAPVSILPRPALQALQTASAPADEPAQLLSPHRKRMYKAALMSALVPGLGEYYTGHRRRALISGTLEAAIWTSFITFKVQEDLRGDRAIDYAVAFAGARPDGDDDYYKAVGQFLRSDGPGQWNEFVRRRARDTGEIVGREYGSGEGWAWSSLDRFIDYRGLRKDELTARDHARNALAVAIANRIVSMVSVVQAVRADAQRDEEQGLGLKLELGTTPAQQLARVGLWDRF
jgi:hypothetical protein